MNLGKLSSLFALRRLRLVWLALIAAVLALTLSLAACGGDDSSDGDTQANADAATTTADDGAAPEGEPIVIGAAIAETGFISSADVTPLGGLEVWVDDINEAGGLLGRPVELVVVDMKSDAALGASAALDTIDQGAVIGVVTCDIDVGSPAAVEFAKNDIMSVSLCAGTPEYGPKTIGPLAFSAGQATSSEAAGAAMFAAEEKDWKTAFVLKDTLLEYSMTWGDYFVKSFESYGGEIVGQETYNNEDSSVQTQISRIQALPEEPDVIVVCGIQPGGPVALRQMRAAGITTPILMCNGLDAMNWLPSVPGLKDAFVVSFGAWKGDDTDDDITAFFEKYIDKFGEPNNGHAAMGYVTGEIIAEGVEKAGSTDGPALVTELEKLTDFDSLLGCTTFNEEWHISFCRPTGIKEIANGDSKFVVRVNPDQENVFYPGE